MSAPSKIEIILNDLTQAESDLSTLIVQVSADEALPSTQINALIGMQDTLAFYKQQLESLSTGKPMDDDLVAIIEAFALQIKALSAS